jgi:hypothetical protein
MPASVVQSSEALCASIYSHTLLFKRGEYAVWMPSNFMPLHGRAEAEELHKDHLWCFQTNSKNVSKVLDNNNILM